MLAQKDNALKETCETVYKLNQNEEVRYLCEMREEGQRILRTYESLIKMKDEKLAEKDAMIAALQAQLAEYQKQ